MGTLFPDSDEYPDYRPVPSLKFTLRGAVTPLAVIATIGALCPLSEEAGHPVHESHAPVSFPMQAFGVSSSTGNSTFLPASGNLGLTGFAPTITVTRR